MKEPFTIQMDRLVLVMGRDVVDDLGRQVHAHDQSLPESLEEQLRLLLEQRALAFAFLEAAEKCRHAIGLPEHQDLIAATTEAHNKLVATFLRGQNPPSIGNPFEPPPPPPTKAVEEQSEEQHEDYCDGFACAACSGGVKS